MSSGPARQGVERIPKNYHCIEKIDNFLRQFFEKMRLWNRFFVKRNTPGCESHRGGPKPLSASLTSLVLLKKKIGNKIQNPDSINQ